MRVLCLLIAVSAAFAQSRLSPGIQPFESFQDRVIALQHIRVIDGTGAPARDDETVIIDNGKITAVGPVGSVQLPTDMRTMDLSGNTMFPGLIGMHEHLFYPSGEGIPLYTEQAFSAPRLYLAAGVTTMRTAGSLEPYTDLNVKAEIDSQKMPGPKIDATGPYIQGPGGYSIQMPVLTSPEATRRLVNYWVQAGATSFKAYMNISHEALAEAIRTVHEHKLKITGHLCSVGFTEAAELGIDDLEHGLLVDTEFDPGKTKNVCPSQRETMDTIAHLDLQNAQVQKMIHLLVDQHVAITSTLAVFEAFIPGRPPIEQRVLDAMSPVAAESYLEAKERVTISASSARAEYLKKEMDFERAFVARGGLLIAGCDPTGNGGALPGFGDQRNLELLVEAGFTPEEAIRIYTLNGATYEGISDRVGTIASGKQADVVVVEGNPAEHINDVERVKYVFKNGVAYDPAKLIASVRGSVGIH
ncbi:MAG: amidohydrolase family protein [Acidobacteriaceae bacterium]|nr:amidohydrolase family protein [Acidobacteriaceae bacterium]MBV9500046.1 amidohydrolase family protein [Acidobacteriaceae bacterium]